VLKDRTVPFDDREVAREVLRVSDTAAGRILIMILGWDEVVRAVEARAAARPGVRISGWSIDTRTLEAGDLFFALAGPEHDVMIMCAGLWKKGPREQSQSAISVCRT